MRVGRDDTSLIAGMIDSVGLFHAALIERGRLHRPRLVTGVAIGQRARFAYRAAPEEELRAGGTETSKHPALNEAARLFASRAIPRVAPLPEWKYERIPTSEPTSTWHANGAGRCGAWPARWERAGNPRSSCRTLTSREDQQSARDAPARPSDAAGARLRLPLQPERAGDRACLAGCWAVVAEPVALAHAGTIDACAQADPAERTTDGAWAGGDRAARCLPALDSARSGRPAG